MTKTEQFTSNLEFMLSSSQALLTSVSISHKKVALTLIYSLAKLNLKEIQANTITKGLVEALVDNLIKLSKDSGNEIKILAMRILAHLSKINSFKDDDILKIVNA